ncbi:GNAT family N-acetyltransferase, partial [Pseudoalteromonas sp. NBT06-2]|uniref:GNAT family N-acetyltransferase n=1 Tax=Pseudoalteromonas sp. NBT06-2 TaxID=2025950 RepID=UPI000BA7D0F3
MAISLREVTKDNWEDIILLEITKEQEEFVALNAESIAGSKFNEHYVNRAVYFNDEAVGFIQYFPNFEDEKPNEIYIDQFMIDVPHQGKGYGTEAMKLALHEITQQHISVNK